MFARLLAAVPVATLSGRVRPVASAPTSGVLPWQSNMVGEIGYKRIADEMVKHLPSAIRRSGAGR
jgi:hypothetical protein